MRPRLRVIAGRLASNAPMVRDEEKPRDAIDFMNVAGLVVLGILGLVGLWALAVLVLALERVAS